MSLGDFVIVQTSEYTYINLDSSITYYMSIYGINSLLLLSYKPVQNVTVQNNTRLNQVQEKMMQPKNTRDV